MSISVHKLCYGWGFPGRSLSKVFACKAGDPGYIPGLGRYPGIEAWEILWTEDTGRLHSMGSQVVRHYLLTKSHTHYALCEVMSINKMGEII